MTEKSSDSVGIDLFASALGYVFDYVVGVLWLLAPAVAFLTPTVLADVQRTLVEFSKSTPNVHVPDLVIGFLLVIAGIVLPYCVAAAIKPLTSRLMSRLKDDLPRWWSRLRFRHKPRTHTNGQGSEQAAQEHVQKALGLKLDLDINRDILLTYLYAMDRPLANRITLAKEVVLFRAMATLPSALFLSACAYRAACAYGASDYQPAIIAAFVALVVFKFGVRFVNLEFDNWRFSLYVAVLLARQSGEVENRRFS